MSTKHLFVSFHIRNKSEAGAVKYVLSLQYFFTDGSKAVLLSWICFCYLCFMSVVLTCLLLAVTCLERAYLLALLYAMFSCVFFTFLYSVLGQVWYLILSI